MTMTIDHTTKASALPGQLPFLRDDGHRFVALEGGLGAGKTYAGAWKAWRNHLFNAFDDEGQPTYCQGAIIGDTISNLHRFDVPTFLDVCERAGVEAVTRSNPPSIHITDFGTKKTPSVIHLCSAESPDRIAGFSAGWFWGDEAARWKPGLSGNPKDQPLIQTMSRLRGKANRQQGIFTYTPEGDATDIHLFMRARNEVTNEPFPDRAVYVASTRDNYHNGQAYIDSQLSNLSADLVKQYVDGLAISFKGARAYSLFERITHTSPADMKPCDGIPLVLTLDFNIAPGMHALIGQYSEAHDRFHVTHEIHGPRMDVRQCASAFCALLAELGGVQRFGEVHIYGDATGNSEWAGNSQSCYTVLFQCLEAAGVPYRNRAVLKNPAQSDRVNAVQSALMDVKGEVHIAIHPRCKGLIKDLEQTKWDDKGRELDKRRPDVSHYSDAFGYWVYAKRPVRLDRSNVGGRIALQGR